MERDTRPIYVDALREDLDAERRKYTKQFNRLYDMSASGRDEEANRKVVAVKARWERAKANYLAARAANPVPDWAREGVI